MDEIEYNIKLSTNNPTVIALTVSKLCDIIIKKHSSIQECSTIKSVNDIPEFNYLKSKCTVNSKLIALTAAQGITLLVQKEVLQLKTIVMDLISVLPHSRCYSGIISVVCDLLLMEAKINNKLCVNSYKLLAPQHPIITILLHDFNTWKEIFQKMKVQLQADEKLLEITYRSFKIVFFFIICNPDSKIPIVCQSEMWKFLVQLNNTFCRKCLLDEIIPWISVQSTISSFKAQHIISIADYAMEDEDYDLLYSLSFLLVGCVFTLTKLNEDPRDCIDCLTEVMKVLGDNFPYSFSIFIITEAVNYTLSIYLINILTLCKTIIMKYKNNIFCLLSLKSSLLNWLMFSSNLTKHCNNVILDILSFSDCTVDLNQSKKHMHDLLKYSEKIINLNLHLCSIVTNWKGDQNSILKWLKCLINVPSIFLTNLFTFLSGIVIWKDAKEEIISEALQLLLNIITFDSNFSGRLLTLILYKLSNEKDPLLQLILLNALPKLISCPQNLPIIVHTIHSFTNGPENLKIHSMKLLYDLWIIEPKCYTHLQKMLLWKPDSAKSAEFYMLKAYILKEICLRRPEVYGTEMVSHLSDILNKCSGKAGAAASALALQGIMHLCKASIIDVPSTWNALAPKFKSDTRPAVIISLCNFFAEIPECYVTPEKTDILDREVIDKLWELFRICEDENVLLAIAKALGKFNGDKVREQAPGRYFNNEEQFDENSWLKIIEYSVLSHKAAGNLLISLIHKEIREFRGGVYLVPEGRKEPYNYNYLPKNSVLRAIGNYVVKQFGKSCDQSTNIVFAQCLRILSKKYSKPLPPLDWCFLHELVHVPTFRCYVLTIASNQILLSGTARRIIDNFISEIKSNDESIEDVMIIYESLNKLCNGIQPIILQPFIKESLLFGVYSNEKYGKKMLQFLKETVADKEVHMANKSGIADTLKLIVEDIDIDSNLYPLLLDCCVELEDEFIYLLNKPTDVNEQVLYSFEKTVDIRTKMVQNRLNMKHFNICLDTAVSKSEKNYVESRLIQILFLDDKLKLFPDWLTELLGKIQAATAEDENSLEKLTFLCGLYITCVVILSGAHCLCIPSVYDFDKRLEMFPLAVSNLLKRPVFMHQTSQVIEWIHYMVNYKHIPIKYRTVFHQCLIILKNESAFQDKWMKYAINEFNALS